MAAEALIGAKRSWYDALIRGESALLSEKFPAKAKEPMGYMPCLSNLRVF